MSIQVKNNIDPIDVKADLRAAIKVTQEPVSRRAMQQALKCMAAYDNALKSFQDLNAKALAKIRVATWSASVPLAQGITCLIPR